jgi:uncharacterized protein YeaO (DUF488 family)
MAARLLKGACADRSLAEGDYAQQSLRGRFHGDPAGWKAFKTAYYAELREPAAQSAIQSLLERLSREPVTLLFAARNETQNNAIALKEWLDLQN